MLLDEPHAGLDAEGRAVVDEVLANAAAEERTVLIASHEVDLARRFATREVAIVAGRAYKGRTAVAEVEPLMRVSP